MPVDAPPHRVDLLLAQAQLAASIAANQISQDKARRLDDEQEKAEVADEAGRRRREAAELEAAQRDPALGTDAAASGAQTGGPTRRVAEDGDSLCA